MSQLACFVGGWLITDGVNGWFEFLAIDSAMLWPLAIIMPTARCLSCVGHCLMWCGTWAAPALNRVEERRKCVLNGLIPFNMNRGQCKLLRIESKRKSNRIGSIHRSNPWAKPWGRTHGSNPWVDTLAG